jgi:hypothetical protein
MEYEIINDYLFKSISKDKIENTYDINVLNAIKENLERNPTLADAKEIDELISIFNKMKTEKLEIAEKEKEDEIKEEEY